MTSEFDLIKHYFAERSERSERNDVLLGIGDDCALLRVPAGKALAVSLDMLVAGRHFPADTPAIDIGHKALAVNLSDLAAQGAEPAWVTLGLALPEIDATWLEQFCQGFFILAERFKVRLVGGDTTRGSLTVAIQIHGFVSTEKALCRSGAKPGDVIMVTGTLGDAGLALAMLLEKKAVNTTDQAYLRTRLQRPMPRITQGLALAGIASAAIDISDGLAQDLGHILNASGVGARLWVEQLPLSSALQNNVTLEEAITLALSAGDDYELCFTVPAQQAAYVQQLALEQQWDCACHPIGVIEAEPGLRLINSDGSSFKLNNKGYDHFSE